MLSASQVELIQNDIVRTEVKQKEKFELPPELEKVRAAMPDKIIIARPAYSFENENKKARARAIAEMEMLELEMEMLNF